MDEVRTEPRLRRRTVRAAVVGLLALGLAVADGPDAAAQARPAPPSWPSATTTGVPANTRLRPSGPITVSVDGTVIDRMDVDGCVIVRANNVVIRRSRIRCGGGRGTPWPIRFQAPYTNLLVEDVEIDGLGVASVAICCAGYTLRRVNVHDVVDGPRLGSGTSVEASWIHDLARTPDSHNDTLQTTGGVGIVVRGNRLEPYHGGRNDPHNAALMIGSTSGPVSNLLVEGNFVNGGNYTINIRRDAELSNVVVRSNTFGSDCRYGAIAGSGQRRPVQLSVDRTNRWAGDGSSIVTDDSSGRAAASRCSYRR